MKVRRHISATVVLLTVVMLSGGWLYYLEGEVVRRYGVTPGVGGIIRAPGSDGTWCMVNISAIPAAHYNLWGEFWQDPFLDWSDLDLTVGEPLSPRPFPNPHSGPVSGQDLCGIPTGEHLMWRYLPEDRIIRTDYYARPN